jgi:hypothetical protein
MLNIKQLYNKVAQIGLYGKRLINQVITISTTVKGIPINKDPAIIYIPSNNTDTNYPVIICLNRTRTNLPA